MLKLYWCTTGLAPLAAFGWVMATHLSLYPAILIIPVWCCSNPLYSIFNIICKTLCSSLIYILSTSKYIYYPLFQVILLLGYGPDAPPRKLFCQRKNLEVGNSTPSDSCSEEEAKNQLKVANVFSWRPVVFFLFWTLLWSSYVLVLCGIYVQQYGGLQELFKRFCLNTITNIHFWQQFCKHWNISAYLFIYCVQRFLYGHFESLWLW